MKRLFLIILAIAMMLSMTGCIEAVLYSFEAEGDLSIVFTSDDEFYCYGDRSSFSTGESHEPYKLTDPAFAMDVALTDTTAVFLTGDGLYATGVIADLPFGDPSTLPTDGPVRFYYDEYTASFDVKGRYVSADLSDAKQIVAGDDFTLVLKNDGTVYGWGSNSCGQLMNSGITHTNVPVKLEGLEGISKIDCCGEMGMCAALDMDGHVWVWGAWLDSGARVDRVPFRLDVTQAVEIACGAGRVAVLDADAKVWMANFNTSGLRYSYGQVEGLPEVFSLVATEHAFAAKDGEGNVWTWGNNHLGELGRPVQPTDEYGNDQNISCAVQKVEDLSNVISLSAGKNHFMAMTQNMAVYAWGDNSHGQLGIDPDETPYSATPVKAPKINANVNK